MSCAVALCCPRRLVDDSKGPEVVVASKCFLWEAHASQLGDWLEQASGLCTAGAEEARLGAPVEAGR